MGFFGSGDKTNLTQNSQTGASDDAILAGAGGAGAKDGGISIATGLASTNKFGTTEVVGSNGTTINQGFDASAVSSLLEKTTNSLGDLVSSQTRDSLDAIAGLAETKQTDGSNLTTNAGLWLGLAAVAALAWIVSRIFEGKKS